MAAGYVVSEAVWELVASPRHYRDAAPVIVVEAP